MSIFEEMQGFNNINLGPTIQQFQILNVQLQNATNNSQKLESATKSLDSKGMAALSGTLGNVQNLFQSLGVELDSLPNRILSVATATTGLIGSMQKLNELKVTSIIKETFSKGWADAAKQTEKLGSHVQGTFKDLGSHVQGTFKDLGSNVQGTFKDLGLQVQAIPAKFTLLKASLTGTATATKGVAAQTTGLVVANQANTVAMTGAGVQATVLTAKNKKLGLSIVALKKKLTLKNILLGATKVSFTLLNVVKGIFNALLAANPIVLLIAGIGALVALGPKLIGFFTGANKEAKENKKAIKELSEEYEVSTEQIEADMERMGKNCKEDWKKINEAAEEAAHTFGGCSDEIRGEIADLINEHENYDEAMKAFKEQQIEMLTDVASQWGMTGQEVHDVLEDMTLDEFTAQQEAQLDELSEAWNTCGSEIQRTLEEQGITMVEWENQQQQLLKSNAEEWGLSSDVVREHMSEMGMSADEWAAHMGEAWEQFNTDVQSNVGGIINGFKEIPTEYEQSAEDLRKIMENNTETTREWQENMGKLAGRVSPEMLAHLEAMGPEFNSVIHEMLECDDELEAWKDAMDDATEVGTQQALANVEDPVIKNALEHQLEATGQAVANNTALAEGYEHMHNDANARAKDVSKQGGVEAGKTYGNEFVKTAKSADYSDIPDAVIGAMDAGQGGMVQAMTSSATAIVSALRAGLIPLNLTATSSLAPLVPLFKESGRNMAIGLQTGITSSTVSVTNAMTTLATGMHNAFKTANQEDTSSRLYRRSGGFIIDGLVAGLTAGQARPITSLQTISTKMRNVFNNVSSTYQAIGREIMNGLNQGLLNGESTVMATSNRIANNIARTMRNALDINSPSRVMREQIGRFIPEGVAAGIDKYADTAINSVHKLSSDIINLNIPSVESMIGLQPSMRLAGATRVGSTNNDYRVVNNNQGLFEGANINWSGEQDIRRTMEKIAWVTKQEQARLWR